MLEVSSVEPSPRIDRWWGNSSDETTLHILFCAKTLLTSPMECPPRHHKETYAMIYTFFTGLMLANAITPSPPHPLSDDSPPTKQKSVGNFTIKPSHQQNRKTMPCYAPATTTLIVVCNY